MLCYYCNPSNHSNMDQVYSFFSIAPKEENYVVTQLENEDAYTQRTSCRKAVTHFVPDHSADAVFHDDNFILDENNASGYSLRRIYEFYDQEFYIFDQEYFSGSHLELTGDEDLPTFLSEFSMIDHEYIKTRFFTKRVNAEGFYKYFVRRNGEYHVEYIDDVIPVFGNKKLPIWGLTIKEPWKLILLKAWLKEKGGVEGVISAQPYEFIEAFGLPGYRALSIKKQLNFLKVSKIPEEVKAQKEKRIRLNEPGFITVGKTRDNEKVSEMGLKRNRAGYKIVPIDALNASSLRQSGSNHNLAASSLSNEENIYKVQSELPVFWVGEYSVVSNKIRTSYNHHIHKLNIEKEFLATYNEISNVFSKFYITPEYSSKYGSGAVFEDSHRFPIEGEEPYFIFKLEVAVKGFLNLNVDLPLSSVVEEDGHKRYSPIKYFMVKKRPEGEGNKLGGYQFYDGEYVKGYHKSLNRFLEVVEGTYIIYVKIDNTRENNAETFAINISTNAVISKFERNELTTEEESDIIKSAFYEYSKQGGIRCYVHKEVKDLLVYICNKFDELGFGFIALYAHPNAKGSLALDVNRTKLGEHGLRICAEAQNVYGEGEDSYKLVAKPGEPEVLVVERTMRIRSKEEQFPPEGTIDFYEIY